MVDDVVLNKAAIIERCVARAREERIPQALAERLQRMVGFRNIAVHAYQELQLPIVVAVITGHLVDFTDFSQAVLLREGGDNAGQTS